MENVINIGMFIGQLTYFIKVTIYVNKGTDKDATLERCIKLYNKYKTIESTKEINEKDEAFVRKCLKRLNLVLKVDSNGGPVNIRNKENQVRMVFLQEHESLSNDNMNSMIEYGMQNNIDILTEVPLTFALRESKYQELLWQYTRSLFYVSQFLLSYVGENADPKSKIVIAKKKINDDAVEKLETILVTIDELEEKIKLNQIMTLDKFLNSKLIKTGINETNVNEAREEVKQIFQNKGLSNNSSMSKMIDSISNKLTDIDLTKGNIIQSMIGIAQTVAQEMRGDLEKNPEQFHTTLGAITEVFQEAMESDDNKQIPPELKNIFNAVVSTRNGDDEYQPSEEEVTKSLESIIAANGLDRDEFFTAVKGNNGEIDPTKFEKFMGPRGAEARLRESKID